VDLHDQVPVKLCHFHERSIS